MSNADDLDCFVRDLDHLDSDFSDFDGKVEAAYRQHTSKLRDARPRTAAHRRPSSAEANGYEGTRSEYKPKVSPSVLEEVRNTLNPNPKPQFEKRATTVGVPYQQENANPAEGRWRRQRTMLSDASTTPPSTQQKARPRSSEAFLREHRIKRQEREKKVDMAVDQSYRELEHSYLYKMGEMNQWCYALSDPAIYRPFKMDDGDMCCHVYENGLFVKELSIHMLEKRYKTIQGKYREACLKGRIEDERMQQCAHLTEEQQVARKQEIRDVILHTMHLTTKIKEQLRILQAPSAMISPFVVE